MKVIEHYTYFFSLLFCLNYAVFNKDGTQLIARNKTFCESAANTEQQIRETEKGKISSTRKLKSKGQRTSLKQYY